MSTHLEHVWMGLWDLKPTPKFVLIIMVQRMEVGKLISSGTYSLKPTYVLKTA